MHTNNQHTHTHTNTDTSKIGSGVVFGATFNEGSRVLLAFQAVGDAWAQCSKNLKKWIPQVQDHCVVSSAGFDLNVV